MRLFYCFLILSLSACGGRVAKPVPLETSLDARLTCAHHAGEYENNIKRLEELTGESREAFTNNLGFLLVSPLFLDFSSTRRDETEAIIARNQRLEALMAEKDCPAPAALDEQPTADAKPA